MTNSLFLLAALLSTTLNPPVRADEITVGQISNITDRIKPVSSEPGHLIIENLCKNTVYFWLISASGVSDAHLSVPGESLPYLEPAIGAHNLTLVLATQLNFEEAAQSRKAEYVRLTTPGPDLAANVSFAVDVSQGRPDYVGANMTRVAAYGLQQSACGACFRGASNEWGPATCYQYCWLGIALCMDPSVS